MPSARWPMPVQAARVRPWCTCFPRRFTTYVMSDRCRDCCSVPAMVPSFPLDRDLHSEHVPSRTASPLAYASRPRQSRCTRREDGSWATRVIAAPVRWHPLCPVLRRLADRRVGSSPASSARRQTLGPPCGGRDFRRSHRGRIGACIHRLPQLCWVVRVRQPRRNLARAETFGSRWPVSCCDHGQDRARDDRDPRKREDPRPRGDSQLKSVDQADLTDLRAHRVGAGLHSQARREDKPRPTRSSIAPTTRRPRARRAEINNVPANATTASAWLNPPVASRAGELHRRRLRR